MQLTTLINSPTIAATENPKVSVLAILRKFTLLSGWALWPDNSDEQLIVLDFVTEELRTNYPNVTIGMFERALIDGVKNEKAYERKAMSLFVMLNHWLIDNNDAIYEARKADRPQLPALPERTEQQKAIDRINLVQMLFDGVKNNDQFLAGWSSCFEFLKDQGIIVKGDAILADIWKGIHVKNKAELLEKVRNTPREERFALKSHLDNFEARMNEEDYQIKALTQYHEAVCRHFFTSEAERIEKIILN